MNKAPKEAPKLSSSTGRRPFHADRTLALTEHSYVYERTSARATTPPLVHLNCSHSMING